ncbi:MAG: hypothetical protein LC135_17330 [Phycisphaerae bacterium]|jgi:hypothetical protein|nr:hypothetical protein [Phycisphaerae bacterium]MCZ2401603.1 hypothetical protein [Phycisphaerae bacterium]
MRRRPATRRPSPILALLVAGFALVGCASPGPARPGPRADAHPAAPSPAPRSADAQPATEPVEPAAPEPRPADAAPAAPPPDDGAIAARADNPYAIPYLRILELRSAAEPPVVTPRLEGEQVLVLETRNVQRLRITREHLAIRRDRSVILRIDGQNFEWTRRYDSIELHRDQNGFWNIISREPAGP